MGERFSNRAQYVWKEWTKLQSRETERNREYALLEIPEVTRGFTGSKHSPPGAPVISETLAGMVGSKSRDVVNLRHPHLQPEDLESRTCRAELCSFRKLFVFKPHLWMTVASMKDEAGESIKRVLAEGRTDA